MSEEEGLIRRGYEAWNRGDWVAMEELVAPDFEIDATDRVLNPDRYCGMDGFRRLAAEMEEIWDSWDIEPEEFIENGELVFAAYRVHARGKGSGIEINRMYWSVWTVRGARAVKLVLYADRGRALAAAGIA